MGAVWRPRLNSVSLQSSRITAWDALPTGAGLKSLHLGYTGIDNADGLNRFPALERLNLSATGVSGVFPIPGTLRHLDLSFTKISGLDASDGCRLEKISFADTPVGDLSSLNRCAALAEIEMRSSAATSLVGLSGLSRLRDISASHAAIRQIADLHGLDGLEWLDLSDNSALESIEGIQNFKNLTHIYLYRTPPDLDVSPLLALPRLRDVGLPAGADPRIVAALRTKGVRVRLDNED
ncbi:MAG: leucine-rich repeat domain-containing protein [Pikeienuella sp.]